MDNGNGVKDPEMAEPYDDYKIRERIAGHIRRLIWERVPKDEPKNQASLARLIGVLPTSITKALGPEHMIGLDMVIRIFYAFKGESLDRVLLTDVEAKYQTNACLENHIPRRRPKARPQTPRPATRPSEADKGARTYERRSPRVPVDLTAREPGGSSYKVLDMSLGGLGIRLPLGSMVHPGRVMRLRLEGAPAAAYVVAWAAGERAGLKLRA